MSCSLVFLERVFGAAAIPLSNIFNVHAVFSPEMPEWRQHSRVSVFGSCSTERDALQKQSQNCFC